MDQTYIRKWKRFLAEDATQSIDFTEGKTYEVYDHDWGDWVPAMFVGYNSGDEDYVFKLKGGQNEGDVITVPYEHGDSDIRRA
jgi:hypothetical protein